MEVSGNFLWISGLDIDFLASLYHNRVNSDSFEPLVQHPSEHGYRGPKNS